MAERLAADRAALVEEVPADTFAGFKMRLAGSDYKASEQAANWAGKLVGEFFDLDVRDRADKRKAKEMLAAWIDAGELEVVQMQDAYRRVTPHVKPVAAPPN
ncbi:hypothetical protein [Pararhizobium gei]|uniref:hypothetical protein n=1 Tax=Pararhizobium gei TaxID=1395951 RepID=UPI0023DCDD99|nr:hypothetical protein [Rhizobium gei]